ncbi:bifunctional sugar phosphate isomerase/epimerase/4-hydroxyphenylpyruvate dioxygenase family protein [Oceanobacter mangrovi]|uniref:bifunctional sugar phosphate isomerase/epimerase/4-hydroxyphenylpyruvate dioxygenase family protein n=1 Tax=Oceanobacter mangrovi TaxID=2862510 RepID=UPI001C8EB0A0|nr:sugar phosphate isomerase/epimerase and 4-hydroxyphenylpyruvate domain-containing protein [Oceanobacter mangrovi]
MKTSLATVSISGTLEQKLQAAARAGFDAVEIFENDFTQYPGTARDVRKMCDDLGLHILAFQPFRDGGGVPAAMHQQSLYRMAKKFEVMHELGTSRLLVCSVVPDFAIDDPELTAAQLHDFAEIAKDAGVSLAYEALAWGKYIADYDDAWEIVKKVAHPNLGIGLDTFHMFSRGCTLDTLEREITPEKIALVQVADAPLMKMEVLQYSRHYRCFPGQGEFPMVDFMRCLKAKGFDDYVSHEIFNDDFRASSPVEKAVDGMRSLIWLDRQSELPVETAAENIIDDVEFVEFAVAGETGEQMVAFLQQLGFSETHQHKSKQVTLMRQGDINLVLNREPQSQAHKHFEDHGVSVCALAFSTPAMKKVMQRAELFRCPRFTNQTGPGELNIPAIRGVGDSLVYFVDRKPVRFFELDFEPIVEPASPAASSPGLSRIDHIGQTVASVDFLSAGFFYKSLFDFSVEASQDLPDLHGLVVSRTAVSPNRKIRIPLNMTTARAASAQRFLDQTRGSGVQQLAFACEDIFAAAAAVPDELRLDIPANYYRDLEARFQLSDELIERLKANHILYDRNDQGEFFHFYTREQNGMFFEVLQRCGNYDRYGEANAFIRLAAQARAASA